MLDISYNQLYLVPPRIYAEIIGKVGKDDRSLIKDINKKVCPLDEVDGGSTCNSSSSTDVHSMNQSKPLESSSACERSFKPPRTSTPCSLDVSERSQTDISMPPTPPDVAVQPKPLPPLAALQPKPSSIPITVQPRSPTEEPVEAGHYLEMMNMLKEVKSACVDGLTKNISNIAGENANYASLKRMITILSAGIDRTQKSPQSMKCKRGRSVNESSSSSSHRGVNRERKKHRPDQNVSSDSKNIPDLKKANISMQIPRRFGPEVGRNTSSEVEQADIRPKRKRGRPRKYPLVQGKVIQSLGDTYSNRKGKRLKLTPTLKRALQSNRDDDTDSSYTNHDRSSFKLRDRNDAVHRKMLKQQQSYNTDDSYPNWNML
jgi:hypothetical protein